MKARALQVMLPAVSVLVALAVSMVMTPMDGAVLCIASSGHTAVEFSAEGCCVPFTPSGDHVEAATSSCGECVDLPLAGPTGCLRLMRPALPNADASIPAYPLHLGDSSDWEDRGSLGSLAVDRCSAPLASLSTVVLLT